MAEEQQAATAEAAPVIEGEATTLNIEDAVADIADALSLTPADEQELTGDENENAAKQEEKALAAEAEKEKAAAATAAPVAGDEPPNTWRKEAKDAWAAVSPVVKEELRKREADIAGFVQRMEQPKAIAETLTKILEPHLQMFEKHGINAWDNIAAMMKAQDVLLFGAPEAKIQMIQNIARNCGVTLEGGQLSAPEGAQAQYIERLEARLNQLEGGVRNVSDTVMQARSNELQGHIAAFASDPAHPHFMEVAPAITHLIKTGAAPTLQAAYDLAVMANPITRAKAIKAEGEQSSKLQAEAEAKRATKALAATKVNVRSTSRSRQAPVLGSIDDTLKESLAEIQARH